MYAIHIVGKLFDIALYMCIRDAVKERLSSLLQCHVSLPYFVRISNVLCVGEIE